jgi:hypothetical protein
MRLSNYEQRSALHGIMFRAPFGYSRRMNLAFLSALALELKVLLCAMEVDNRLGRHDDELWASYDAKSCEFDFWKMVLL